MRTNSALHLGHRPLPQYVIEVRAECVSVVLITQTATEVDGKGRALVCNFTGGTSWRWECPSWSQRSNLPLASSSLSTHRL